VKVSILIPTYNSKQYLSECLDSIVSQDFTDMEILISDDVSTDDTLKAVQAYAVRDARIRWWQNPRNLGFVGNHNACLQQATGEYIKFLHPDDQLLSTSAIRKMVAALMKIRQPWWPAAGNISPEQPRGPRFFPQNPVFIMAGK